MCGIIGVISQDNRDDLGALIAHGLYQLQHRGDYSAGVATIRKLSMPHAQHKLNRLLAPEHTVGDFEPLALRKGRGKVSEVFSEADLAQLHGFMGIGQVRYPTAGYTENGNTSALAGEAIAKMRAASLQPMHNPFSRIAMVHNGDVHNFAQVIQHFTEKGLPQASFNDLEAILKAFSEEFHNTSDFVPDVERISRAVKGVFEMVKGTYAALAVVNNVGMVAFRDPEGRRPLVYGVKRDKAGIITDYAFASETVALSKMLFQGTTERTFDDGSMHYDEVRPGEMLFVSKGFELHRKQIALPSFTPCPFEGTYFARASSIINDRRVKDIRRGIIEAMWTRFQQTPAYQCIAGNPDCAVIVGVPRTAETAAKHLSNITGITLEDALEKHPYAPRIFQQPTQDHRVKQTIADHFVFEEDVKDKVVILIDDSIVRGTTMQELIKYIKDVGATQVHLFSTFPPIRHPCMHAIDFHTSEELIAHGKSLDEVKTELGLRSDESLVYALPEDLRAANGYGNINMCDECYHP